MAPAAIALWLLVTGSPFLATFISTIVPLLVVLAVAVLARDGGRLLNRPETAWDTERKLAAIEVGEAENRDVESIPAEAARIFQGDVPALDDALQSYQLATGTPAYPRFERLPRSTYLERVDACVRLENGTPVLCFTPKMLEAFSAPEFLAVIAHLLARAEFMRRPSAATCDGVREADARALLVTRDHVALLRALERSRDRAVPAATPGDREAWFSEDDVVPESYDDSGNVERWRRVDRLEELRAHLGALGMDVPLAPATVRLARLYDVETGMLTEAAKDGLR
jgi:hypothetical protein